MAETVTGNYVLPAERSCASLQKIAAVNVKALTKLAGLQLELATLSIETGVAHARLYSQAGGYERLYSSKLKLATLYGNRVFEISRETTDILLKSGDELNSIVSGIFSTAKVTMAKKALTTAGKLAAKRPAARKAARKK